MAFLMFWMVLVGNEFDDGFKEGFGSWDFLLMLSLITLECKSE